MLCRAYLGVDGGLWTKWVLAFSAVRGAIVHLADHLPLMNELIAIAPQVFEHLLLVFELLTLLRRECSQLFVFAAQLGVLKLGS